MFVFFCVCFLSMHVLGVTIVQILRGQGVHAGVIVKCAIQLCAEMRGPFGRSRQCCYGPNIFWPSGMCVCFAPSRLW